MAGHSFFNGHRCKSYRFLLFCVSLFFLLWGCGSDTSEQGTSDKISSDSTDTGSAFFAIQWKGVSADRPYALASRAIHDCGNLGVESITCQVYDESYTLIANGGPWNCSDRQGTIERIPAGSNRTFALLGWSDLGAGGDVVYQGQTGSTIKINPGEIADAGTIDAYPFVPEGLTTRTFSASRIDLSWEEPDENASLAGYRIYRDGVGVKTSASPPHNDTGLIQNTEYCYTVSAYDAFGNESGPSNQGCDTTWESLDWYRDKDKDKYGDPNDSIKSETQPEGYVSDNADCNDDDPSIHPGATEACNGDDDDCDGSVDEGLTQPTTCGVAACAGNSGTETCVAGVWGNDTCDPFVGATSEVCDGLDNDCDGTADEGIDPVPTTCGIGECASRGELACIGGQLVDSCQPGTAREEVCDGLDNDCDGSVDEGLTRSTTCGVGACANNSGTETCVAGVWGNDTCDPYAGATSEVCDNVDNDCDGEVNNGIYCPECYPDLPSPNLEYDGSYVGTGSDGKSYRYFDIIVSNSDDYPDELFTPAPHLPPCGTNYNSSRTWVDIYEDAGPYIYGFCGLSSSTDLESLWFATPVDENPPDSIYIELVDRECDHTYVSNPLDIKNALTIDPPPNLRILDGSPTLRWNSTSDEPHGYRVYWRLEGNGYDYSSPIWEGINTTATITGIPEGNNSYFVVRAYIGEIESENSNEVTIEPPALVKATLISPTNESSFNIAYDESISFSWNRVPGATRYYIAIRAPRLPDLSDDVLRHDAEVETNSYTMPLDNIQKHEIGEWIWAVYPLNDIENEKTVELKSEIWYFWLFSFDNPY